MIPDGVVPEPLARVVEGLGARPGEARSVVAQAVAEQCEAIHWAELTRAREKAIELDALGCRLPTLLGEYSTRRGKILKIYFGTVPPRATVALALHGSLRAAATAKLRPKQPKQ